MQQRALLCSRHPPVSHAAHRAEVRGADRVDLELLAEPPDVNGHGCGVAHRVAPNLLQELVTAKCPPGVRHQLHEELELLDRESEGIAPQPGFVRHHVDLEVARGHDRAGGAGHSAARSTEDCLHPSDELTRGERLCDVVVGPELEPCNPIFL